MFVLTRADEHKIDVDKSKEKIQKILTEGFEFKSFAEIIRDQKVISNKDNLLVTAFSNKLYRNYLNMIEELKNFQFLEDYKCDLKKIKNYLWESFMDIDEKNFQSFKEKIQINENNDNYKKFISKLKDKDKFSKEEIIEIIYIFSFILENNRLLVNYRDSYAEKLFSGLKEQINNTYKIYKNNLKVMCFEFFFQNLF